jgi:hypothetical protein
VGAVVSSSPSSRKQDSVKRTNPAAKKIKKIFFIKNFIFLSLSMYNINIGF